MQGLLASQGMQLPKGRDVRGLLETMRMWNEAPLPAALRARLQRQWEHAPFLQAKILELQRQHSQAIKHDRGKAIDKVRQLLRPRGIGENGAWVYANEFFGWRQFNNRKEVGAAAGLTPTPYQSGDGKRELGISKAGNRHIRAIAIEMAWCWLRYQPESHLSRFEERFSRGGPRARKVGIVALAHKLLIEVWRFLKGGTIPAGALLKHKHLRLQYRPNVLRRGNESAECKSWWEALEAYYGWHTTTAIKMGRLPPGQFNSPHSEYGMRYLTQRDQHG